MKSTQLHFLMILAIIGILSQPGKAQDTAATAQTITQTVKGTVIAVDNEQPIIGARVILLGTKLGARTKTDGTFRIEKAPVGRHTISVVAMGYETISQDLLITSGKQVVVILELREKIFKGEDVTVYANGAFAAINEVAITSATNFTVDDVKRFAGSREDPAKMAQNFAGVVGINDQRNDIIIRGGSPLELLWRLDGIDIPNPNHFATQGATGGPVNTINVNLLNNSDFLTGAFPAEYGDKLSGVFDLHTRRGNTERYEFIGQLSFAGLEALAEGPIPWITNGSFIMSFRKSTLQIFDALGINFGFAGIPKYDDLTIKADIPIGNSDVISLTSLYGTSDIALLQSVKDTVLTGDFDITNGSDLFVIGATWKHLFDNKTAGQLTLSRVDSKFRTTLDSLTSDANYHFVRKNLFYNSDSKEGFYSAKYRLSYSANTSNTFSGGFETRLPYFNLNEYRTTARAGDNGVPFSIKADGNSFHALSFLNWLFRPTDELTFNGGVHFQYLQISKKSSFEPRLSARWNVAEGQSFSAGFGVHRESQPLALYLGNPRNNSLDFTQSLHYVLGYENRLANDLLLKIEGYYKDISKAPVELDSISAFSLLNAGSNFGNVSTNAALTNNGNGKTYGIEFTMMKHFTDNYYFTATTSLFGQRFTGSDGVWRDGAFDNRYIVNLLAGYDWVISPSFSIEFSAKFSLAGGAPYTPIDTVRSALNNNSSQYALPYLDEAHPFSQRNPYYTRLDTKIEFRQNLGSISIISFLTAENTLNNKNVLIYTYDPRTHTIKTINQLGIFPYGGVRVEF